MLLLETFTIMHCTHTEVMIKLLKDPLSQSQSNLFMRVASDGQYALEWVLHFHCSGSSQTMAISLDS